MKKLLLFSFLLIVIGLSIYFKKDILNFYLKNIKNIVKEPTKLVNNEYSTNASYKFVNITDNFIVKSRQDIINVYYTVINSGMDEFTFYCDKKYEDCIIDINDISNDQKLLTYINNFVPVYNSFKNIETEFNNLGKIDIRITHDYTKEEIIEINKKIDEILKKEISSDLTNEAKIKKIHDYIINNSRYDKDKADKKENKYKSDIAYGCLIQGYAICGGYADSMKLFLDKLNIPNFKISSENHIWNVVYLNNKYLHLDLTWDDPITSTGEDKLEYNYFLITTDELNEIEKEQHTINYNIYQELKNA